MSLSATSPLAVPASPAESPGFAYSDIRSLQRIKTDDASGIRAVAQQFESLFIGMMLKSMREANAVLAESSMLSSPELSLHEEMLDQQWAIHMAESGGIGLATIIESQLGGARPAAESAQAQALPERRGREHPGYTAATTVTARARGFKQPGFASREAFVAEVLPQLQEVLADAGLRPTAVLAQSALETGWGQRVIHGPDGASSHNLFGIKAGRSWEGPRVEVRTLEVIDGHPRVEKAEFRSYPSVRAAVEDYVRFLESDSRYRDVLEAGSDDGFAGALQRSGYATDPAYASKIRAVIGSLRELTGA
ncbi:MAG: flagellar assembly peptidoglycan hydrolase FlgJ [Pseudomonadales bacterium]